MEFRIEPRGAYLHAELRHRDTAAQMREFLEAVKAGCLEHGCPHILISIRDSRAVFKAEEYGLGEGYASALVTPSCRVALVGDSAELHHAHEYIELVARQQQVNLRSFRDPAAAVRWLGESEGLQPARPAKLP